MPVAEALPRIELYDPFPNSTCMRCHTTTAPKWSGVSEHASLLSELREGLVSCASEGCHGPAHPFAKPKRRHE
jgi:cytochrome c-type protein NapC